MKKLFPSFFVLFAASHAFADTKPELIIYTYDSFISDWGPGPAVEKAFEAVCDCDLKLMAIGDGAGILSRLQLEGSKTNADIVLGLDTSLIEKASKTGMFAPHNVNVTYNLPIDWQDDTFVPYDWGRFAFVYDKTKIKKVPTNFEALAKMPDDFKIIIQDPRSSTPGLGLLLWVKTAYPNRSSEIWEGLAPHILTVTKGWSQAYGMFLEGEADMVLSYTTSPAYHIYAEQDDNKATAKFDEGHYLQIEVAAKLNSSDQQALADKFLAFMTSESFQKIIPTTNWMYPAVNIKEGLPVAFNDLTTPTKDLLLPAKGLEPIIKESISEWSEILSK